MLRDAAVSILKGRLARWNDTVLTDYIVTELQAAQQRAELRASLPWFLLTESSYTTTTSGEERIEIPADFLREAEEDALWMEDAEGTWAEMRKDDYSTLRARYPESGKPRGYALVGNYFRLFPVPDSAGYTAHMIYYAKDAVLTANVENNWLAHAPEVLISDAGHIIASRYVRNDAAAAEFKADYMRAYDELRIANQARRDANRVYGSEN